MKTILYIYHTSAIGGGSFCLLNIINNINLELYKPIVLLKEEGPLSKILEEKGIKCYYEKTITTVPYNRNLFNVFFLKRYIYIIISCLRINKIVTRINPDIIHINSMMLYPYLIFIKDKKKIIHIREHWPNNQHIIQFNIAKFIVRKYCDKIIAINETSKNMIDCPIKTKVIYDYIDFDNRDDKSIIKNVFGHSYKNYQIYTFTGGIDKIKGTYDIVSIFSKYINDPNARLLILGADTKLNYKGVKGSIAFYLKKIGYDTYENNTKLKILKDHRIKCISATYNLKSILQESFCILSYFTIPHANLTLAESIILGKIVIAAKTPEALEYSNNGKSALLFNINDKNDFLRCLNELNYNYNTIKKNVILGSEINKDKFSKAKNSKILDNIYKHLI